MRKLSLFVVAVVMAMLAVVPAFAQDAKPTIADIVVQSASGAKPEFATLLAAVKAADPSVLAALSNADGDKLTVFAPTDAAFAAIPADTLKAVLADQSSAQDQKSSHPNVKSSPRYVPLQK